jgi:ABC-type uncharacterized transport system permease subunit
MSTAPHRHCQHRLPISAAPASIGWRLFNRDAERQARCAGSPSGSGFLGLLLHTWLLYRGIFSHAGLNLAFFNALSLAAWTVVASLLISSLSKPIENLGAGHPAAGALTVLLDLLYPSVGFMGEDASWVLKLHVLLSMLAYSLLTWPACRRCCWRCRTTTCASASPAASSARCRR